MLLSELFRRAGIESAGLPEAVVSGVTEDSRRVRPGFVFVAVKGGMSDGHDYAAQAKASGAMAVVGDRDGIVELAGLPYLHTPAPRRTAAVLSQLLAGEPSRALTVIGVTGTNGKSSTVFLIRSILEACGLRAGSLGTLGYDVGRGMESAPHTTPFGEDLARALGQARDNGLTHIAMETSSHAIEQGRIAGIRFRAAVFTNLTQDHLDYHRDMDGYCEAKLALFRGLEDDAFGVINTDDPYADRFRAATKTRVIGYGAKGDVLAEAVRAELRGSYFRAVTPWGAAEIAMHLIGRHNVSNALAAIATAGGLGLPLDRIAAGVRSLRAVPGRFERIECGQDFEVVVDYAHTDDGLRNALAAAREVCEGKVIVTFGCGGDRDKGKRPKMAKVAAELADYTIITSDNPRTEDPDRILLDIEVGIQHAGKKKGDNYAVIRDRREAIAAAIAMARAGDLVLIAGKGHEDYQILGTERIHFDDREAARAVLEGRAAE